MKGVIFYYSNTGNTRLLCELLKKKLDAVDFELCSISEDFKKSLDDYQVIGFACYTDQMQIPALMKAFMGTVKATAGKPAFVLNTFGSLSGRTLLDLRNAASKSGYRVLDGISVHVPENYPPMLKRNMPFTTEPSKAMISVLEAFIGRLNVKLRAASTESESNKIELKIGFAQYLQPVLPGFLSRLELGSIQVKRESCTQCGLCVKGCPVRAIELIEYPIVNAAQCQSCWKCYNSCPKGALYGSKFGEGFRYPKPHEEYRKKLEAIR